MADSLSIEFEGLSLTHEQEMAFKSTVTQVIKFLNPGKSFSCGWRKDKATGMRVVYNAERV